MVPAVASLDLLQKSIFAAQLLTKAPTNLGWGENTFPSPAELGSQHGLEVSPSRATGVDLGGIPGFMQEVYSCAVPIAAPHPGTLRVLEQISPPSVST